MVTVGCGSVGHPTVGPLTGLALVVVPLGLVRAMVLLLVAVSPAVRRTRPGTLTGLLLSAVVLVTGDLLMARDWPAHPAGLPALLRPVARIGWSETLGLSAYWLHPAKLESMHTSEVSWMLISLMALTTGIASMVSAVRSTRLPAKLALRQQHLCDAAAVLLLLTAGVASSWALVAQGAPNSALRAGNGDLVLAAGMLVSLVVARIAAMHQHLKRA